MVHFEKIELTTGKSADNGFDNLEELVITTRGLALKELEAALLEECRGDLILTRGEGKEVVGNNSYENYEELVLHSLDPHWQGSHKALVKKVRRFLRPFAKDSGLRTRLVGIPVQITALACLMALVGGNRDQSAFASDRPIPRPGEKLYAGHKNLIRPGIVFVDAGVSKKAELMQNLGAEDIKVILPPVRSPLSFMVETLLQHGPVSSLHIISHGSPGELHLGGKIVTDTELEAQASQLAMIGSFLVGPRDIMLYGCRVAEGERGKRFVERLGSLTGSNVAASTDTTGSEEKGGDWDLELVVGDISSKTVTSPRYTSLLDVFMGDGSGGGGGGVFYSGNGGDGGPGGGDDDTLTGTAGNDVFFGDGSGGGGGGAGEDSGGLGGAGGSGNDSLFGGEGDDVLFGDGFDGFAGFSKGGNGRGGNGGYGGGGGGGGGYYGIGGNGGEIGGGGGGGGDYANGGAGGYGGGGGGGGGYDTDSKVGGVGGTGGGMGAANGGTVTIDGGGGGGGGGFGYGSGGSGGAGGGSYIGGPEAGSGGVGGTGGTGGAAGGSGGKGGLDFEGGGGGGGMAGGTGADAGGVGQQGGNQGIILADDSANLYNGIIAKLSSFKAKAGGAGNDILDGGPGSDHLFGMGGRNIFVFEASDGYSGVDVDIIHDWNKGSHNMISLTIDGTRLNETQINEVLATQTGDVDRTIVHANNSDRVTIIVKDINRPLTLEDFKEREFSWGMFLPTLVISK